MKNLSELYERNFVSVNTFDAEDSKPFKFAVCVEVYPVDDNKHLICVAASKLPKYLTKKQRESIASSCCISTKEITVNDVCQYGLSANLDSYLVDENDIESKLSEIDNQIPVYGSMCGFYFDKQQNRIGNDGWDFLNGKLN